MRISLRNKGAAGLKMWEAEVTSQGVTIRYGSVGKQPRTQTIPLSACKNGNPGLEAVSRAEAKRKEGYWDVTPSDQPKAEEAVAEKKEPAKANSRGNSLDSIQENTWF